MKYKKELIKSLIFILSAILILGLVSRFFSPYQGDGIVLKGGLKSIGYPIYEIQFPSFPVKKGITRQTYRFTRICNCKLDLRLYLIAKSDKQVYFLPGRPKPAFLDTMKIAVKLLEDGREVIRADRIELLPSENIVYLIIPQKTEFHDRYRIKYNFFQNSTYELQLSLEVQDKLPQRLEIKAGLAPQYGYDCAIEACSQTKREYM